MTRAVNCILSAQKKVVTEAETFFIKTSFHETLKVQAAGDLGTGWEGLANKPVVRTDLKGAPGRQEVSFLS